MLCFLGVCRIKIDPESDTEILFFFIFFKKFCEKREKVFSQKKVPEKIPRLF